MNWDAVGAIAELLAALGVIVSFVYLARQIRQNTLVQRRTNVSDIATDLAASLRTISTDPEMSTLALRALSDLDSLDPAERYRFDCFFYPWVAAFERALIDARDGEYPDEYLTPMRSALAGFLRTDGGRAWWKQRQVWFTTFGAKHIEEILGDEKITDRGAGPPAA
jgi:hypothetical protein